MISEHAISYGSVLNDHHVLSKQQLGYEAKEIAHSEIIWKLALLGHNTIEETLVMSSSFGIARS